MHFKSVSWMCAVAWQARLMRGVIHKLYRERSHGLAWGRGRWTTRVGGFTLQRGRNLGHSPFG